MSASDNPTSKQPIGSFLRTNDYRVPRHQRGFSWSEKEVSEFLSDVSYVGSKNQSSEVAHYLGTIVLYDDERSDTDRIKKVIDGQQRLTVISLFLKRLLNEMNFARNQVEELGPNTQAEKDFLNESKENLETDECAYIFNQITSSRRKLVFKPSDVSEHQKVYKSIMKDNISKLSEMEFDSPSSHRVENAYKTIDDWFVENLRKKTDRNSSSEYKTYYSQLNELKTTVIDNFVVTKFIVSDHQQAGRMFNVLNNRGKDLNSLDRVKSHSIYQLTSDSRYGKAEVLEDYNEKYSEIQENVTSIDRKFDRDMNRIVRLHWGLFYKGQNKGSEYIPDIISTNDEHLPERPDSDMDRKESWIEMYIESIYNLSTYYEFIYSPFSRTLENIGDDNTLDEKFLRKIYNISSLSGNEGVICLTLSLLRNLDWEENEEDKIKLNELIGGLESLIFRRHKICKSLGRGSNSFENESYTYANKLEWWDKKQEHKDIFNEPCPVESGVQRIDILDDLESDINDQLNKTSLKDLKSHDILSGHYVDGWTGVNNKVVRRILFEREVDTYSGAQSSKITGLNKTSLEHIMPQDRSKVNMSKEKHRKNVNKLGNLILLSISENSNASNKRFRKKSSKYSKSNSSDMAQNIAANNSVWKPSDIDSRTKDLVKYIGNRWTDSV